MQQDVVAFYAQVVVVVYFQMAMAVQNRGTCHNLLWLQGWSSYQDQEVVEDEEAYFGRLAERNENG